ncbi:rod shape-determining protein MreC [Thermopolyspora sp. NPDC052614]|uniref:rod shape-determining protein MreC n=1 Tax=Thermopolyspora sp. NPDC052614 TaxID=3155682 RepID=UPI0034363755
MRDTRGARVVLGLLLAAALVLITVDHRGGGHSPLEALHGLGADVFSGVERAGANLVRPVRDFAATLAEAPSARRRIEELERENGRLRAELTARAMDRQRSEQLGRLLGLAGLGGYRIVPGQVIARRGVPGLEEVAQIDVGTADGVRPNMTVLNPEGLVGRVIRASEHSSTVALLTDPASAVGARLEGGNEIGVVKGLGRGMGDALVRLRLFDSSVTLTPGQRIVSFGSQEGAPYVAGVPIGVIERVEPTPGELTKMAIARPYADFSALDVIGVVVQGPRRDPRDAVLPPARAAAGGQMGGQTGGRTAGETDRDARAGSERGNAGRDAGRDADSRRNRGGNAGRGERADGGA